MNVSKRQLLNSSFLLLMKWPNCWMEFNICFPKILHFLISIMLHLLRQSVIKQQLAWQGQSDIASFTNMYCLLLPQLHSNSTPNAAICPPKTDKMYQLRGASTQRRHCIGTFCSLSTRQHVWATPEQYRDKHFGIVFRTLLGTLISPSGCLCSNADSASSFSFLLTYIWRQYGKDSMRMWLSAIHIVDPG